MPDRVFIVNQHRTNPGIKNIENKILTSRVERYRNVRGAFYEIYMSHLKYKDTSIRARNSANSSSRLNLSLSRDDYEVCLVSRIIFTGDRNSQSSFAISMGEETRQLTWLGGCGLKVCSRLANRHAFAYCIRRIPSSDDGS